MKRSLGWFALVAFGGLTVPHGVAAETPISKAREVLGQSAARDKYTFILFYKEDNPAVQTMAQTLKDGVAKRKDQASLCFVLVTDPAEKETVERFGVARAPLPFTVAVAPNGAVTGVFSKKLVDANLDASFVTRAMAHCMKSMQEKKLVLIYVHAREDGVMPAAVKEFQADLAFRDRLAVISLQTTDPAEAQFLQQMEIDPATLKGPVTVFLAPPGVLVGKFDSTASKSQMAAALHKAGKCCDDPNCKHAQGSQAKSNSNTKRN